jgi:hypothetical protein
MDRQPTASTLLKRRQVTNLDGIRIISVPYWEWNELGKDRAKNQEFLLSKLGLKHTCAIAVISQNSFDW